MPLVKWGFNLATVLYNPRIIVTIGQKRTPCTKNKRRVK